MPYRRIYIPRSALDELSKYGFNPRKEDCTEVNLGGEGYWVFESEKGDTGAILARYNVPREKIGLCVTIVKENGGFEEDVSPAYKCCGINNEPYCFSQHPALKKPRQEAFPGIFNRSSYDETSHLTPDGKRKRRKRR